tara:strand:- start:337 stop:921 length:585 start_codon:yes stop_codon:yes gene_type:complete
MEYSSMVDVKTHECFPTLIHEVKMNIGSHDKTNMRTYIERDGRSDDLHTMSYFKSLSSKVLECSEKILKDYGHEFEKLEITSMWGNLLHEGADHSPHTHSNNILSGVYYLKSGSPIQFFDPRPQANVMIPKKKTNTKYNCNVIQLDSTVDTALFFPSWLMHWVPPTPNERISVSWNVLIRGHYGDPNTLQNAYI